LSNLNLKFVSIDYKEPRLQKSIYAVKWQELVLSCYKFVSRKNNIRMAGFAVFHSLYIRSVYLLVACIEIWGPATCHLRFGPFSVLRKDWGRGMKLFFLGDFNQTKEVYLKIRYRKIGSHIILSE
jgi:hypothetical protein